MPEQPEGTSEKSALFLHPEGFGIIRSLISAIPPEVFIIVVVDGTDDLAGVAVGNHVGGDVLVTRDPAPMTVLPPMDTPGMMMAPAPIHTFLPMLTGAENWGVP